MIDLGDPFTKRPLTAAIDNVHDEVGLFFTTMAADDFFARPEEGWSPAENLQHLTKSVAAVNRGMKFPKIILRLLFGTSATISRRLRKIAELYRAELAKGAKSSWRYSPSSRSLPEDLEPAKEKILKKWEKAGYNLLTTLEKWEDPQLDKYQLPHPILGKITVREMLLFTLYHNLHHMNGVRKKQEPEPVSSQ